MTPKNVAKLDDTDTALLHELAANARQSFTDLARTVGLSTPATADRVRRLEDIGLIERFTLDANLAALGYSLQALVRIKPLPGRLHIVEDMLVGMPEVIDCDKVTGDDCFVARLALVDISDLDELLADIHNYAETNTALIKSSCVRRRLPPPRR